MIESTRKKTNPRQNVPPPPLTRINKIENLLLVVISVPMMILPVCEIVARRLNHSIPGESVYVQHLTLWLGFLGALLATEKGAHLGLATANFLLEGKKRIAALQFGAVVAAITCALLAYASARVVDANREGTATLAGGIPEWATQVIVPIAFALCGLRFLWNEAEREELTTSNRTHWQRRAVRFAVLAVFVIVLLALHNHSHALKWVGFLVILAAFLLGAPVFVAMSAAAMLLFYVDGTPIAAVPTEALRLVENPTLPAIPLLTLAGYVLASGKASGRLVRAYKSLFGWIPGGIALMVISVCALFTTFTGGSGVTILALGGIVLPALLEDKYPEGFSLGLVTAAGSLGLLFPPSLPVILYGAVASVAPDKLYLAGLVPGSLLIIVVSLYAIRIGIKSAAPRQDFDRKEVMRAFWAAKYDLGLPILVLIVFASGWATVVEAAALGATYAVIVELIIFRDIKPFSQMPTVMAQSATLVGAVIILLAVALGLTSYMVDAQIPDMLIEWVTAHFHSSWTFLLALNGILLVLGSVFEIYAAIIVLAPLIAPLGNVFNIDPVHLGVVFLANLELGFLFPPMGLNLFLSASRFEKPLPYLYKQALPFLFIMAVGVLVITYVPALTTGVLHLFAK